MRSSPWSLFLGCIFALLGSEALAVEGPLSTSTTWSGSVSMTGDVRVPPGVTLTISAGTTITASPTDSQSSGASLSSVELIVEGSLVVQGTASQVVTFQGTGTSTWYGVVAANGSTVTIAHAVFKKMVGGVVLNTGATVSNATFGPGTKGLTLSAGNSTLSQLTFTQNSGNGMVVGAGTHTLSSSLFHHNGGIALQLNGGTLTVDWCTFVDNSTDAIDLSSSATGGTLNLESSIVSNNGGFGVDRNAGTANVTYSNVWNNGSSGNSNYWSLTPGVGTISANPLYVNPSAHNYRLTSHSPSRKSGKNGVDMGVLPYTSDPTVGLQGKLWSNQTLSGAVNVLGDLTVASGVTLTISAGTTLTFASSDSMGSGTDKALGELTVEGSLLVLGSAGNVVTFQGTGSSTWQGLNAASGSALHIAHAAFKRMVAGVVLNTGATVSHTSFGPNTRGLTLAAGNSTLSQLTFTQNALSGMVVGAGTHTLSSSLFHHNGGIALQLNGGTLTVDRCTLVDNTSDAIDLSSSATGGTLNLESSIVTNNGGFGVDRNAGTANVTYSNVWSNGSSGTSNYWSVTPGTGTLSVNPLYVNPSASNYRLTSHSLSRQSGKNGVDMGALPYTSDPTVGLHGKLFSNQTLSGAVTALGDLTVPAGVTLTISPGTTLTFAPSDSMAGGSNPDKAELMVEGTLLVQGAAGNVVTFQGNNGTWQGLAAASGSTVNIAHAVFKNMLAGVVLNAGATVSNTTFGPNTKGLTLSAGNSTLSQLTFTQNSGNGMVVGAGTHTLLSSLFHHNGGIALQLNGGTLTVDRCTFVDNTTDAIDLSSSATGGTLNLESSIVSHNGGYSVDRNAGTANVTYSNVWNNGSGGTSNYWSVTPGVGTLSVDPLYLDRPNSNYRLGAGSPSIGTGKNGVDMGAFPYLSTVDRIVVTPATSNVSAGGTQAFTAVAYDAANLPLAGQTFTWTASRGTISSSGVLTAGCTLGAVTVTASAGGKSGSAQASVVAGSPATVEVTPANPSLAVKGTQAFSATVKDSCQNVLSAPVSWSVAPGKGTITQTGVYTAPCTTGVLTSALTATVGSLSRPVNVTVNAGPLTTLSIAPTQPSIPTGGQVQFTASGADTCGNPVPASVAWSAHPSAGTISAAGLFTATGPVGSYPDAVTATASGVVKKTSLNIVGNGLVETIVVTPASGNVAAGGTKAFTAQAFDSGNNPVNVSFSWNALPQAGTISGSGVLTAGCTPGTLNGAVTASAGGKSGTASITIVPGGPSSLVVSPSSLSLAAQGTQTLTATVKDSCGNALSAPVSWSVTPGQGSITTGGVYTAPCPAGAYPQSIKATAGSLTQAVDVTVTPGALASLTLSPTNPSVAIGAQRQFSATGADACGNALTPSLTWAASPAAGVIHSTGMFTAGPTPGVYPNAVTASANGVSKSTSVSVTGNGLVETIVVTPADPNVPAGSTQTFVATAYDSAGVPVSANFSWTSAPGAGSISSSGVLTAGCALGPVNNAVTARANGKGGSASITIVAGQPSVLEVSPLAPSLTASETQAFTAVVKDSCGNPLPASVSWTAANGKGSVTSSGLYTAPCTAGQHTQALTATAGALSKSVNVTVVPGALNKLSIQPLEPSLPAGGAQQFTATGSDACGNVVSANTTWSALPSAGSMTPGGLLTASLAAGSIPDAVTARSGAVSASTGIHITAGSVATVTLTPPTVTLLPLSRQVFTAVAKDSAGNVVPSPVSWSVVAGGGTIAANGEFTADASAGTFPATVKAAVGGVQAFATVVVQPGPASRLAVTPTSVNLAPGGTTTFTAQVFDVHNNLTTDPVQWSMAVSAAGTITPGGVFTAGTSLGNYPSSVLASSGSVSGAASVTITAGALSQLILSPPTASIPVGGTIGFSVTGKDAAGNLVPITPSWNVLKGGGAISATGVFTASGVPGTYADTVQVTANGIAANATVVVTTGPVVQVSVTPTYPTLVPGEVKEFAAMARDSFGNEVTGLDFTWSADPRAGTIDDQGRFTAGTRSGDFPNAVSAEAQGIAGAASVRINGVVEPDGGNTSQPDGGLGDGGTQPEAPHTEEPTKLEAVPSCGCASSSGAAWLIPGLFFLALCLRSPAGRSFRRRK